MTFKKSEG